MKGLDIFRDAFSEFSDDYVLIGGSACEILMAEAGILPVAVSNHVASFYDRMGEETIRLQDMGILGEQSDYMALLQALYMENR